MSAYELNKTILKDSANLKAYYRFESGALTTDSGANGYTLTNNNTVAEGSGKYGGGADFGASNTNKSFSYANGLVDLSNSAVSFSTWFNLTTAPGTGETQRILEWQSTVGTSRYLTLQYEDSAGVKRIRVDASNSTITYNTILSTGTWYHIAFTISAAGTVRVYLNGAHVATGSRSTGTTTTNKIVYGNNDGGTVPVKGLMDDTAIFTAELSADQIKELYEGRYIGEWMPQANLVGLWHLNGNSTDTSGNNNHGTDTAITYSLANGKFAQGAGFNGSTSKITVMSNLGITNSVLTEMGWMKINTQPSSASFCLVAHHDATTKVTHEIIYSNSGGVYSFSLDRTKVGVVAQAISFNLPSSLSGWHHYAITDDGYAQKLYLDGSLVATGTLTGNGSLALTSELSIGASDFAGTTYNYANASIDEVVVIPRVMSSAEIKKYYAWSRGKSL